MKQKNASPWLPLIGSSHRDADLSRAVPLYFIQILYALFGYSHLSFPDNGGAAVPTYTEDVCFLQPATPRRVQPFP